MWRDRGYRMQEILDATPTPSWVFVSSKLATMWLVLFALWAVVHGGRHRRASHSGRELGGGRAVALSAANPLLQFLQRLPAFDPVHLFPGGYEQSLCGHAGDDCLIRRTRRRPSVLWDSSTISITTRVRPGTPYSDMNGDGHFLVAKAWFLFYWTWFAALLVVLTFALWNRGALTPIWLRVRALPVRLGRAGVTACAVLLVGFIATGGVHFLQHQRAQHLSHVARHAASRARL